jgi:hypothetical protein
VTIEIDKIELLPFASITDEDLARTGEPDLETFADARPTPARSTITRSSTAWSSTSSGPRATRSGDP